MKRQLVHIGLGTVVLAATPAFSPKAFCDDLRQQLFFLGTSPIDGGDSWKPVPLELSAAMEESPVVDLTDGGSGDFFGALLEDGRVYMWGRNDYGQCDVPEGVGNADNPVRSLATGRQHSISLQADGQVATWGNTVDLQPPTELLNSLPPLVDVFAGVDFSGGLIEDGRLITWGRSDRFPASSTDYPYTAVWDPSLQSGNPGIRATKAVAGDYGILVAFNNGQGDSFGSFSCNANFSQGPDVVDMYASLGRWAFVRSDGSLLDVRRSSVSCTTYSETDSNLQVCGGDAYSLGGSGSSFGYQVTLQRDGSLRYSGTNQAGYPGFPSGLRLDIESEIALGASAYQAVASGVPVVENIDTGAFYPTISEALTAAINGQEIYAIESLVTGDVLDFYDRPVMVASRGEILVPANEGWTLAGSARLGSFDATRIEGGLQVAANAAVSLTPNRGGEVPFAIEVETGGRLSLNNNSALQVTAETDILIDGEANLSSNAILFNDVGGGIEVSATGELVALDANIRMASLVVSDDASGRGRGFCLESTFDVGHTTLAGGVLNLLDGTIIGDVTVDQGLAHGGSLNASGTIFGNAFIAGGRVTSLDDLVIVGDLINGADGVVAVQVGTLYVTGGVVNEGQIYGEVVGAPGFMGGGQTAPGDGMTIAGDLVLGPDASIRFSEPLWRITLGGDFDVAITSPSQFELIGSTLRLDGASGGIQHVEATSRDLGPESLAFSDPPPGVSLIRELQVASEAVIVDQHVNGGGKQARTEAIYAARLEVEAGASLTLGDHILYCTEAQIDGTVDRPENIVVVSILPDPDFNNDGIVNGADLAFILAFWGSNDPDVDLNGDGIVSAADLGILLSAWGPLS